VRIEKTGRKTGVQEKNPVVLWKTKSVFWGILLEGGGAIRGRGGSGVLSYARAALGKPAIETEKKKSPIMSRREGVEYESQEVDGTRRALNSLQGREMQKGLFVKGEGGGGKNLEAEARGKKKLAM